MGSVMCIRDRHMTTGRINQVTVRRTENADSPKGNDARRALSTEGPHRPACGTATRLRSSKHAPRFRGTSNEAHSLGTQSTSGLQTRPSSWATPTTSDTSKPRRSPPAYQLHGKGICAHGPTTYSTSPHVERDNNTVHPVRNSPATASRSATDHSHRPT